MTDNITGLQTYSNQSKQIRFVINPVSGVRRDIKELIEQILIDQTRWDWEICLTQQAGDAKRFAAEAAEQGMNRVIACGGDGTLMEVAEGLQGSRIAMGIIPAGTANVMSVELGIPSDPLKAVALALNDDTPVRVIDMGLVDDRAFLLRAGIGYEAEYSVEAARGEKSEKGRFAYLQAAWRVLGQLRTVRYKITVDDQIVLAYGNGCMICNSSSVGFPGVRLAAATSVSDELLDVIVLPDLKSPSVLKVFAGMIHSVFPFLQQIPSPVDHWQGRNITVECSRHQLVSCDGEPVKKARRVTATVVPKSVSVLVPPDMTQQAVEP